MFVTYLYGSVWKRDCFDIEWITQWLILYVCNVSIGQHLFVLLTYNSFFLLNVWRKMSWHISGLLFLSQHYYSKLAVLLHISWIPTGQVSPGVSFLLVAFKYIHHTLNRRTRGVPVLYIFYTFTSVFEQIILVGFHWRIRWNKWRLFYITDKSWR